MHRIVARLAAVAAGVLLPVTLAASALAGVHPGAAQSASQSNSTSQQAQAQAESDQFAPSVNAPISVLSLWSNNGSVTQAPSSTATATAANTNGTTQVIGQDQQFGGDHHGDDHGRRHGDDHGRHHCRHHGDDGSGPPNWSQSANQSNSTSQQAQAQAESDQFAPSVNAPVSILSFGSNNGSVTQAPSSAATATAANTNGTTQVIGQSQQGDPAGGASQSATQTNSTSQQTGAQAGSAQFAPSVNVPVSILSFGSNNGNVTQAPSSTATATAANTNGTIQSITQGQQL